MLGAEVNLNKMTVKSAKDAFFPQCEDLSNFKKDGKHIIVEQGELVAEDFVIFGVRVIVTIKLIDILDKFAI